MKNTDRISIILENEALIHDYKERFSGWKFEENYHKYFPLDKFYLFAHPQDLGRIKIDVNIKIDKFKGLSLIRKERVLTFYPWCSSYKKAVNYSYKIEKRFKAQLYPDENLVFNFAVKDFNPITIYPLFIHKDDYSKVYHLDCLFIHHDTSKQVAWINLNQLNLSSYFTERQYKAHIKKLTGGKLKMEE